MLLGLSMSGRLAPSPSASSEGMISPTNPAEIKRILEAALLTAQEPLPLSDLRKLFNEELSAEILRRLLEELRQDWEEKRGRAGKCCERLALSGETGDAKVYRSHQSTKTTALFSRRA